MGLRCGRRLRNRKPRGCLYLIRLSQKGEDGELTTTCLWQLGQSKQRIIRWDWLECDIRMPLILEGLLLVCIEESARVDLLGLLRGDDAYFIVFASKVTTGIGDRVNVKF